MGGGYAGRRGGGGEEVTSPERFGTICGRVSYDRQPRRAYQYGMNVQWTAGGACRQQLAVEGAKLCECGFGELGVNWIIAKSSDSNVSLDESVGVAITGVEGALLSALPVTRRGVVVGPLTVLIVCVVPKPMPRSCLSIEATGVDVCIIPKKEGRDAGMRGYE